MTALMVMMWVVDDDDDGCDDDAAATRTRHEQPPPAHIHTQLQLHASAAAPTCNCTHRAPYSTRATHFRAASCATQSAVTVSDDARNLLYSNALAPSVASTRGRFPW